MKNKVGLIIFSAILLILLVCVPCLSMIIRDMVEVYKFNPNKLPSNYFMNLIFSFKTYKSFFTKADAPNMVGWGILAWYIISSILSLLKDNTEKYEQKEEYASHGTSRWQTEEEIRNNYYMDKLGWFIGDIEPNKVYEIMMDAAYLPVNGKLNMQLIVVGPPGSIKTTGFVLNNIFHIATIYKELYEQIKERADLVITDPKPELYPLTAAKLKELDYDIYVLDFIDLKHGDSLNAMEYIHDDKVLIEIAQGYVDSVEKSTSGGESDDGFWAEQEGQALAAIMGYVKQKLPKEKHNFTTVLQVLTSEEIANIEKAKTFFDRNNVAGAPKQLWKNFLAVADNDKTRANILGGLAGKLKLFAIEGIQRITNKTTVDISKLGNEKEKPMALFILMPDGDKTFSPIINVMLNIVFKQLYKSARKTRNRLVNPVYFIIEEMANIGKFPNILEMLGTMRGRRIYPMMIWQSLAQMRQRYGNAWEDIVSMCDTRVYLGINDEFTAEKCSNELGPTTIQIKGESKKAEEGLLDISEKTESFNYQGRNLLFPSECRRLPEDKLIMIQRSKFPVKMNKVQYQYWMEEYKICEYSEVFDIPEIEYEVMDENVNLTTDSKDDKTREIPILENNHDEIKKRECYEVREVNEDMSLHFSSMELDFDNIEVNLEDIELEESILKEIESYQTELNRD